MELKEYKRILMKQVGKKELLEKKLNKAEAELKRLANRFNSIIIAQAFIQKIAKETQEKLKFHIENIVQMALNSCYFDRYEFKVEFQIRRGKTEADLFILRNGRKATPRENSGGGVADIISFALRLGAWSLSKTDNVLIFDEPFKNISDEIKGRRLKCQAAEILNKLSKKLNVQNIIVTHDKEIMENSDKLFSVSLKEDGEWMKSEVKEI